MALWILIELDSVIFPAYSIHIYHFTTERPIIVILLII